MWSRNAAEMFDTAGEEENQAAPRYEGLDRIRLTSRKTKRSEFFN